MFDTVLVANRGEIACRVIRTLRRMGIRSVAVYSDADADAPHVRAADARRPDRARLPRDPRRRSTRPGPPAREAVHPGYGFLSENAAFAARLRGGRDRVRRAAAVGDRGDGRQDPRQADGGQGGRARRARLATARASTTPRSRCAVEQVGYPVLLKPSAGGGGKGMREVHQAGRPRRRDRVAPGARPAAASATTPCSSSAWSPNPRHIEIQVLADAHGNVIHLGERECSLQRRHQKIIEEAPSPLLDRRAAGGDGRRGRARRPARSATPARGRSSSSSTATHPDEFFFMEMNTRLQVEHPVTEEIYGADLVEMQLRVAAGEHAPWQATPRARARDRGADLRRGPGARASCRPAAGSCACAWPDEACGWTRASPRAASSAATTTRCWPR